jgi:dolichyl-phosphate-mannose--protein O-mannosyl transferase
MELFSSGAIFWLAGWLAGWLSFIFVHSVFFHIYPDHTVATLGYDFSRSFINPIEFL